MKIPRGRQNTHIAWMADSLGWILGVIAPVVIEGRAIRQYVLSGERVIGQIHQIG
jgi:hypothetical protein